MKREEAVALVKELVSLGLAQPSFISVEKNKEGAFRLTMKGNGNITEIRAFLSDKDLILSEDKEKGTFALYRP